MKKTIKFSMYLTGLFALLLNIAVAHAETWQQTLKSKFDIVDTFDELQDWDGNQRVDYTYGTTYAPKKLDGTASMWTYFTPSQKALEYTSPSGLFVKGDIITGNVSGATGVVERLVTENGKTYLQLKSPFTKTFTVDEIIRNQVGVSAKFIALPKWIGNHGADYVWGGTGKSLIINYNDFSGGIAGFGTPRLGTFWGDGVTGKSGYKKAHLFMMVKFRPGFFAKNADGTYKYIGVLKFFDMCSGFTAVNTWGTSAELAISNGTPQVNSEYGANFTVFNIDGGGSSYLNRIYLRENGLVAYLGTDGKWGYRTPSYIDMGGRNISDGTTLDLNSYYENADWFGLEVAMDIGTPDQADGTIDFWIYDKNGVEKGHFVRAGNNKLVHFDHYFNKITLGGNRICNDYGRCPADEDNRYYVDDVIINKDRIGPTYFKLLAGIPVPPKAPLNVQGAPAK